ncbi:conserved hypothetical protein [Tenacibaculum litopenaei]|uniref:tetratricopeptide repeat protein n=1 Tax=Tenacibaculum litopenaei TaxID=396016 RepID=UPI0038952430
MKPHTYFILLLALLSCKGTRHASINSLRKEGEIKNKNLPRQANAYFWKYFHAGNYKRIDTIISLLNRAHREFPNDIETINHLGFTHIWALSERARLEKIPVSIKQHAEKALNYFKLSYAINPDDPRILGFLADSKMIVGNIKNNQKLQREGYFTGKKAIRQWKSFNYFTIGYPLSKLPRTTWQYKKALQWQWKTLQKCYQKKIDTTQPYDFLCLPLGKMVSSRRQRACRNSWIAPHNIEGFYLNLGDMLVKNQQWKKAIEIYRIPQQLPSYSRWPFREVLEKRINNAQKNTRNFIIKTIDSSTNNTETTLLINTKISCVVCHQHSKKDSINYAEFNWNRFKHYSNLSPYKKY